MASLNIIQGAQTGTHFELSKRPLSVGREASRDIQITDPKVSRKHALIRFENGGYLIVVANARNGVKVNGAKIAEKAMLREGDQIALGDTVLQFTELGAFKGDAVNELKHGTRDDSKTFVQ
jgi:pSer/pThr/pTyr-binding forkhead associated (FHA) protein